jgi:HK97 family phage portal protein
MEKSRWRRLAEKMAPAAFPGEQRVASLGNLQWIIDDRGGFRTAGQLVTPDSAMRLSTVWGCVAFLADIVGGLPLEVWRRTADGTKQAVDPLPQFLQSPSAIVPVEVWRYQMMQSLLLRGNCYGLITAFDAAGWPATCEIVNPDNVQVHQTNQLAPPTYRISNVPVPSENILHIAAWTPPGSAQGMSPIDYARRTIGMGLAASQYASDWYNSDGHPTAILKSDKSLDDEDAKVIKARFKAAVAGDQLAVLGQDLNYTSIQISPAESQFLDAMNATGADVCRFFRVPPEYMGIGISGQSITYANAEQRQLDFLVLTVQWWIRRIEAALTRLRPRPQFVKIQTDDLLRVDQMTRVQTNALLIRSGQRNVDEIRHTDDLAPIPDDQGQRYLWPPYAVKEEATAPTEGPAPDPVADPEASPAGVKP